MMRNKSMSFKLEDSIVFTILFACCGGYQWPILAGKKLQ